jgi:transposase-like protein
MAKKAKIQFQEGISLTEFMSQYGTEEQCTEALFNMKWPQGYRCKHCNNGGYCYITQDKIFRCTNCKRGTTLKSGTVFQNSNLALTVWFQAIYLITQSKHGISAMELMRKLGLRKHDTALALKHKLMQAMQEREDDKKLTERVEIDDAFIGGENHGGKRGRGSENKTPFVAAISTHEGRPNRLKLQVVASHDTASLVEFFTKHTDMANTKVCSDGLACFRGACLELGIEHERIVVSKQEGRSVDIESFTWVNTALGNLKKFINGTHQFITKGYIQRYLAEFQYRFNRRYDLRSIFPRMLYACVVGTYHPAHQLFSELVRN